MARRDVRWHECIDGRARELAAELLGEIATKKQTLEALQAIAKKRWKNSSRAREAANRAAGAIQARWIREEQDRTVPPPGKTSADMPQPPTSGAAS